RPALEINTPFSSERQVSEEDDLPYTPLTRPSLKPVEQPKQSTMSSQPDHPTLLIPGPVELDDEVLQSMSHYSQSHVGAPFVATFGEALTMLRQLMQTSNPDSQPFVISGSGTLGWDFVAANLVEKGDNVLVLHTGYFADSFADCFETYGINATQLKAPIGDRPQLPEVEKALKEKSYKLITVTHVDTSTGVLSEVKVVSELVHRVSPETLVVVDGVCSVGAEDIQFDQWGIDAVLTASQKAIGCPAGLCIMMYSGRAIERFKSRTSPPGSYFASIKNWLPIMQNYEAKKASYFATPSPQLIHALHTTLTQILAWPLSDRFAIHHETSQRIKSTIASYGLQQLATKPENQANGMTAMYLPEGVKAPELLSNLLKKGVVFAGGLHKEIAAKYIRFGHMGVSVVDPARKDIDKALEALKEGLVLINSTGHKRNCLVWNSRKTFNMASDDFAVEVPLMREPESPPDSFEDLSNTFISEEGQPNRPSAFIWALSVAAGISGILFGYDTGVISSTLVSIGPTDLSRPLSTLDKSLITSSTSLFALIASPVASVLADRRGRKFVILAADVLFVIGALWQAFTGSVIGVILGRSVIGLAIGSASLVVPLYISELSPSAFRGMLVTLSILFVTGGQVIAYVLGYVLAQKLYGWRWMVGLGAAPAVLQFNLLLMLPETPRWLVTAGQEDVARDVLKNVYTSGPNTTAEQVLQNIKREITEEEATSKLVNSPTPSNDLWPWLTQLQHRTIELFYVGGNRRALLIGSMLQALQQLCGFVCLSLSSL
ncbi:MAG: hypothetical protein Q9166_003483, partial [cf. Caloplaca sp. 2 TL-2023]